MHYNLHERYLQNVTGITQFIRNTKQYNNLSYIFFQTFAFCNYTLLPACVKDFETFLEAIL